MKKQRILLFGTGQMAYEYIKVLKHIDCDFIVIGRGKKSAGHFQKQTGITAFIGGAEKFLKKDSYKDYKAIVAVTGDQLGSVTLALIKYGIKSILVEKPGGIDQKEIKLINKLSDKYSTKVYIAYNRRFYASVAKAQEIIKQDSGILSFHFEFNEVADQVDSLEHSKVIKNQWLLHNSSHVIDLAFFLGGKPKSIFSQKSGYLDWHPSGSIFTGCGVCQSNAQFTYHANWQSPGRWGIEIMTLNHRLILRPLEKLQMQRKGSFEIINVDIDSDLDNKFKPGLFKEVESFLGNKNSLCTIKEQVDNLQFFPK